ncbi:immunoglobulin-like domain-containing protein [Metabacillus litoralis]|nr:immunoglobulin-like domain-containing protein [Metabacillus litoralis]
MRTSKKKYISIFVLSIMLFSTLLGSFQPVASAEEGNTLILHYDMKTFAEDPNGAIKVKDLSDKGLDGTFKNPENGQMVNNSEAGYISFNGGNSNSKSGYIEIPKFNDGTDLLTGVEDVTISSLVNWNNDGQNRWIFGLGKVSSDIENGNSYFFATPRHGIDNSNVAATGISQAGWRNEALIRGKEGLKANSWEVVTVVFSGSTDTLSLYVNGVKVASGSAKGKKLADIIDSTASFSGFIGKSIFQNDPYYKGMIGDFQVHSKAFTDDEVKVLATETASKINEIDQLVIEDAENSLDVANYLTNGDSDKDQIKHTINLPKKGKHDVDLTWKSNNTEVLTNEGVVTRPSADSPDAVVELTATLSYKELTVEKTFSVTVISDFSNQQRAELDAQKLKIVNQNNVKGNMSLPSTGENGSTIKWESSDPAVIKGSLQASENPKLLGWVTRQENDTVVTLTATVTNGTAEMKKNFEVEVKKNPGKKEYDAYFFSYFTGEYEGGEEISFATAEDPLKWRALNNGQSVIQSTMGEKGLRDPFIMRSPEGDKFYMIATDLKMGESTNFDQAQITGSHAIMIWESEDLVNWSEQRMVEVAPKTGGNTWAPEAYYDKKAGEYVVFWASSMKNEETYGDFPNGRPAGQYNVMYYATTRDFHSFSEPKVFIDEGFPTIDTSFIENEGSLYRFTKSEVGYKVYYEKATDIFYDKDGIEENGYQFDPIAGTKNGNRGLIGHGGNNEGQTVFKDIHEDKWYLFLDSWPYHVRWTNDLDDGQQLVNNVLDDSEYALPPGPRHGTVIPITRDEYNALQEKYGMEDQEPSKEPVVHYSFDSIDGATVKDDSGNGHDAQLVGGAEVDSDDTVGHSSGSINLDGTTGYVELPENIIKNLNLKGMTMSSWVKVKDNQTNQRIFDFSSDTGRTANRNTMYLSTQGDSGNLEFATVTPFTEKFSSASATLADNYKYAITAPKLSTTEWHHVAVTIEDFDAVIYVDGKEVARNSTFNVEPRMLLETSMNYLGKSSKDEHHLFNGKFDEFKIFNHALSDEEISELAQDDVTEPPDEEPSTPELILDYDMKDIEGITVEDRTGKFNGTFVNPENAELISIGNSGVVQFKGGTTDSYIELPEGVLETLESVTVSSLINWNGNASAEWLYSLGQNNSKYLYFTPKYNADSSMRFGIATDGWRNEVSAKASTLSANEWKLVTTVFNGQEDSLKVYIDGELIASGQNNGISIEDIKNAAGKSGYIGKSMYNNDPYFGGMIADFEIYNGALSDTEVSNLTKAAEEEIKEMESYLLEDAAAQLDYSDFLGKNESNEEIKTDLSFPNKGENGTTITWQSKSENIITNNGKVNRPAYDDGNKAVVLVATLSDGTNSVTKEFTVTVIRKPIDLETVIEAAKALNVHNIDDVRGNLTLPTKGLDNTTISWNSQDPKIVTETGEVNRPVHGDGDKFVKLTATISLNNQKITKSFMANVKELPEQKDYKGYVFSYFTGEGYENGEQIYFGLSEGNDPLHWQELNNGDPVFTSELGEKGLRDPFIIRSPEGDKFYLIATDLKIHGNGDWGAAQTTGSRSIMVWESTDLVNWSKQRMAEVAPPEAGNTWAPEIFYDDSIGEYVIFWASKLYENENDRNSGNSYQRMMYTTTRDFHTFSEPKVYMDYGYSIIDTTMIEHEGKIYRFTKDERGTTSSSPNGKFIFQEVGNSVLDPNFQSIKEGIGKGDISRGEGPAIFKSNTEDKWYLFIDEFGGRGYVPFETTDLASGEWTVPEDYDLPSRPRHGTVLPVTQEEYDALLENVPVEIEEPSSDKKVTGVTIQQETMKLNVGDETKLAATITPENATNKDVVWSSNDENIVAVDENGTLTAKQKGTVFISVTTIDGGYMDVIEVAVEEKPPGDGEEPPGNGEEPPGDGEEPPGDGEEPPGDGEEPPGDGEEPPGDGEEPPGDGEEPPGDGEEPPGDGEEPPGDGEEPPGDGEEPPGDGEEPPGDGEEPPGDGEEPPGDGEEPPGDGEEPPGDGEEPPGDGEEPPGDGEEPPGDGEEPPGDGEEPPGDGEEPPGDGEEPPGDGEEPPGDGEEPPGDGEEPPGDGEEPPGNGEEPPGDGEEPPGNGEEPPGDGEEPPGNGEEPPGDGEEPPGNGEEPRGDGEKPPGNEDKTPSDGKQTGNKEKNTHDNELPSTATNLYNYVILGIFLLIVGGSLLVAKKRKMKH